MALSVNHAVASCPRSQGGRSRHHHGCRHGAMVGSTTRTKSIYSFLKVQTAEKSREWVQFRRFFDRIERNEEIYVFEKLIKNFVFVV